MAKNKHQKLALYLRKIIDEIQLVFDQAAVPLQCIQFHFYEKVLIAGRLLMQKNAFKAMVKAHVLCLRYYSPNEEIRAACCSLPYFGIVINKPFLKKSELLGPLPDSVGKWVVPWCVNTLLPNQGSALIEKGRLEALLYCPDPSEVSSEIDWFEKEDLTGTLTYQVLSALEYTKKENDDFAIIEANHSDLALPYFTSVVEKWFQDCFIDNVPENSDIIFHAPFAPDQLSTVALAYENILRSIRERTYRNYHHLKIMWRETLEEIIFQNLNWSSDQKTAFLHQWEQGIFGEKPIQIPDSKGRWPQCQGTDRQTAAKIIRYFIDLFLTDPCSRKQYGEIACFLWTCVWASYEHQSTTIRLHEILSLTTKQLDKENMTLQIGKNEVNISSGLCKLLTCLLGKGKGERSRRLFENITHIDFLEDALKMASKVVLVDKTTPALPAAFLLFPHPFQGKRRPSNRCQITSKTYELPYDLPHSRSNLIKVFKGHLQQKHNACG